MEQRVSLITLGVSDLARARRFYEEGLGWRAGFASDEVVFFQMLGTVFALFSRTDLAADAGLPLEKFGVGSPALAQNLRSREEVDAVLLEAASAGATILKEASETSWGGYSGYFADPDGHPWEIAWNPGWGINADGGVSLK
ncbi:VOC family protein [Singulisphaera sp. Ch08]|uniref:VOC family protein n=1 Tax=Singulisphaera sp. Ch08 TaxID=3120278 RepID=A0AAU7CM53_9BACT